MKRAWVLCAACALVLGSAGASLAAQERELEGNITDDMCGGEHMMEGLNDVECTVECVKMGAKYALFVPSEKKLYAVENQKRVESYAGERVLVRGTVSSDGETVTVTSVTRR